MSSWTAQLNNDGDLELYNSEYYILIQKAGPHILIKGYKKQGSTRIIAFMGKQTEFLFPNTLHYKILQQNANDTISTKVTDEIRSVKCDFNNASLTVVKRFFTASSGARAQSGQRSALRLKMHLG